MIKRFFIFLIALSLFTGTLQAQEAPESVPELSWSQKQWSIGLSAGTGSWYYGVHPFGLELPVISYRPFDHFQITLKSFLWMNTSLLIGYTTSWGPWRWYLEGGAKVEWGAWFGQPPDYLGPELSSGGEYMFTKWLALGVKLNAVLLYRNSPDALSTITYFPDIIDINLLISASILL